ncbi:hypothetical protein KOY48_05535 [Candidatus Minimicrobia naudis]|uniref:Uncharacterized protein n=1 Tax=Candidatus Minimicrobia naudis TaxID=2841263 RepID=A0A8F1MBX6_9BACT|nr:hypothetical protein KOY48_05535 [Candidatus Minimicrobia naudis]
MKAILGFGVFMVVDIVTGNVMYGILAILLVQCAYYPSVRCVMGTTC